MPETVLEEDFEDVYMLKFRQLLQGRGLALQHDRDRAGIDMGVQLTEATSRKVTNVKVWFQLKGKHASTISAAQLATTSTISVSDLPLDHVRLWYAAPEATYLVVYLEATDTFIAEDVRDIIDRQWGPSFLAPDKFPESQKTVTLKLDASSALIDEKLSQMLGHQSMRIDGPSFRGRPLGHRLDPLRCELDVLEPNDFETIVSDLLASYGYMVEHHLDADRLLQIEANGRATLTVGTLHTTWEWVFQPGTEFGFGEDSVLREEGQVFRAFGRVAVLIHSRLYDDPSAAPEARAVLNELRSLGIEQLLIFANASDFDVMAPYRTIAKELWTVPHGLGTLSYNLLTATLVYLNHRGRIHWKAINYQWG